MADKALLNKVQAAVGHLEGRFDTLGGLCDGHLQIAIVHLQEAATCLNREAARRQQAEAEAADEARAAARTAPKADAEPEQPEGDDEAPQRAPVASKRAPRRTGG